ncbi:hypothetical protein ACXR2U_16645 [Jatrophihabitans sp. YIM 134969]
MLAIDEINGLPAHILLVHAVVVLLPLAAIALALSVLWPAARRRLGIVTPLLALVGLVLVPITTNAGEWLEGKLGESPLIEKHANLGDQLLPFAVALFVIALAHWVWSLRLRRQADAARTETVGSGSGGGVAVAERTSTAAGTSTATKVGNVVFAVLGVVAAALTIWMVVRIGDSGAQAVWQGSVS